MRDGFAGGLERLMAVYWVALRHTRWRGRIFGKKVAKTVGILRGFGRYFSNNF